MRKLFEAIGYSFGFNLSFYPVSRELANLDQHLPTGYLYRHLTDIGCGDGRITRKIANILKPKSLLGVDLYPALIKTARKNGISASVIDVEHHPPQGDLGVLWGVLHHFSTPKTTLKSLICNFNSLIIRESVNDRRLFESGHRYSRIRLLRLIKSSLRPTDRLRYYDTPGRSLLLFIN